MCYNRVCQAKTEPQDLQGSEEKKEILVKEARPEIQVNLDFPEAGGKWEALELLDVMAILAL